MDKQCFAYYNLRNEKKSQSIDFFFPNWEGQNEKIAVFSPHDDDAILGAGYVISAALANHAEVYIFIFCNGCAGYSDPAQKDEIIAIRRAETEAAYGRLGISRQRIIRMDFPDFSALGQIGWKLINGQEGSFPLILRKFREIGVTRLIIPNGYREHIDHEAVSKMGAYDGPQAGDPILADWGPPQVIKSFLVYAVWGDFSPEDSLINRTALDIRANLGIKVSGEVEARIDVALREWNSQLRIIDGILRARETRKCTEGYIEGYLSFDPRPSLDYGPYANLVNQIDKVSKELGEI